MIIKYKIHQNPPPLEESGDHLKIGLHFVDVICGAGLQDINGYETLCLHMSIIYIYIYHALQSWVGSCKLLHGVDCET